MLDRRDMLTMLGAAALTAAAPSDTPGPADLADDLAILDRALALHPGLYRYLDQAALDRNRAALRHDWLRASTLDARYLALSRFLATIRCGHSYANFFNQKKAIASTLFDRPTRLPFRFVWIDGRMIVTADDSGTGALAPGTEVRRINGMPAHQMLAALMPYARADGHNDAKRVALLSVQGADSIEYFDVFQGLLFPPSAQGHRLDITRPDGARATVDVPALTLAQRRATRPIIAERSKDAPRWQWAMRPDGIAVLTMPSWALYDSKWDWRGWLAERLDSLNGAKGLIIDLRANEGGEDCGDPILARLIDRDLTPAHYEQRLRFKRTPADLDRYLDTWDDSFRTLGVGARPLDNGFYLRPGQSDLLTIKPDGKPIACPVAALIGPNNSSATFQFAMNARQTGRVRLIGEATGGNRRGINGGCFFFVRLPASGLEFDLPLVGYFATTPEPDAGLVPDMIVAPTADDIAHGRDPAFAAALAWFNNPSKP